MRAITSAPAPGRRAYISPVRLPNRWKPRAVTGATLPLAEVSQAHRMPEERSVPGRLLLVP
jgi:hypothetical protein